MLISALVVARDEAAQLGDCLEALRFADEIVVVLDRCTDDSAAVAWRHTGRVIEGAWEVEGDRRNAGIAACAGDWVVEVDADERVSPALADELRRVAATSAHAWHLVPVDNYIGGRLVRYGWGASFGRSAHAALFRRGAKTWGRERVHPKVRLTPTEGPRLAEPIAHYLAPDAAALIDRLNGYSTRRALDLRESGQVGTLGRNVRRIFSRFWKCYVGRKGYREGPYGFLIALCAGLYPILSHLKARIDEP